MRIEFINENIKDIQITKDDILGDDLPEKYTESEYLILGLTYEQVSPLELFEDFIIINDIRLKNFFHDSLCRFTKRIRNNGSDSNVRNSHTILVTIAF